MNINKILCTPIESYARGVAMDALKNNEYDSEMFLNTQNNLN